MEVKKFFEEYKRMCNSTCCNECPLKNIACINPSAIITIDKLINETQKWSEENPIITNRQKFLQVFGITLGDAIMKPNWSTDVYTEEK